MASSSVDLRPSQDHGAHRRRDKLPLGVHLGRAPRPARAERLELFRGNPPRRVTAARGQMSPLTPSRRPCAQACIPCREIIYTRVSHGLSRTRSGGSHLRPAAHQACCSAAHRLQRCALTGRPCRVAPARHWLPVRRYPMAEQQTHSQRNDPPPSARLSAPSAKGGQRQDVPYHWPRGQKAPSTPGERRIQRGLIGLVVVLSVLALALLWYMIARSTRGI
jgi:hypothetical protein